MASTRDSWKRSPFFRGVPIPFHASYSLLEFRKIREGLIPEGMKDKWFFYFEEPDLFVHLSWSGQPVYRVTFELIDGEAYVTEALCVAEVIEKTGGDYEAALLDFLISNLLLEEQNPFPVTPGAKNKTAGLLQHVISGTRYREVFSEEGAGRRRWWQFWRP